MANIKITELAELLSASNDDVIAIVDVSDQSQATSGSTRKITVANLASIIGGGGAEELNDLTDVTTGLPLTPTNADDGRVLYYDVDTSQWISDDIANISNVVKDCKTSVGTGTIPKGTPVYLDGYDNDLLIVEPCDASSAATMPCIGITAEDLDSTNAKKVVSFGKIQGVDTSLWADGTELYIASGGGFTTTRPTGTAEIQRIAIVLKGLDATGGQIKVFNTSRTAGLPNLQQDFVWVGDSNGHPIAVDKSTLGGAEVDVVEVIRDSDSGVPTYYSDLQTAINTCKTLNSNNTVRLWGNHTLTSELAITDANGFEFESLTIDFNGFKIINNEADASNAILFQMSNSTTERGKLVLLNGAIQRNNNLTGGRAFYAQGTFYGQVTMDNMLIYAENYRACEMSIVNDLNDEHTLFNNLGGSIFVSSNGTGSVIGDGKYQDFSSISLGGGSGVHLTSVTAKNFYAESVTGTGVSVGGGANTISDFYGISDSGIAVNVDNDENNTNRCTNFVAQSNSNYAINAVSNGDNFSNFRAYSNTSRALSISSDVTAVNGFAQSNGSNQAADINSCTNVSDITFLNTGTGRAGVVRADCKISNCTFIAYGKAPVAIAAGGTPNVINSDFINNTVICELDSTSGNAIEVIASLGDLTASTTINIMGCNMVVKNTSANCLTVDNANIVNYTNCTFKGATTPVNANITQGITNTTDAQGNITI